MQSEQVLQLREILLTAPIPWSTRAVAFLASFILFAAVLWLVRSGRLGEIYTPIWFVAALVTMTVSIWPQPFLPLTRILGAWSHTSIAVFFALIFLLMICLSYAVRLSRLTLQIRILSQELAICKEWIDREGNRQKNSADQSQSKRSGFRTGEE